MLARVIERLGEAGMDDAERLAPQMLREQQAVNAGDEQEAIAGRRVPHLMKSARRAGLLKPEILEALGLSDHPLVLAALRASDA
jgi:hypothetical protein